MAGASSTDGREWFEPTLERLRRTSGELASADDSIHEVL